jgi:hypothetical protein
LLKGGPVLNDGPVIVPVLPFSAQYDT